MTSHSSGLTASAPAASEPAGRPRRRLFGRSISVRVAADDHPETRARAITPLPVLDALELLAAARGISADRAALAAALPLTQEGLAASLAPLACPPSAPMAQI